VLGLWWWWWWWQVSVAAGNTNPPVPYVAIGELEGKH
jgi:hypothetical protein